MKVKPLPLLLGEICALILCGLLAASDAQAQAARSDTLAQLLEAIFAVTDTETMLHTGRLPENLKYDVQLPRQANLLGSMSHGNGANMWFVSSQLPDSLTENYASVLQANGWEQSASNTRAVYGFKSGKENKSLLFCREDGTSLYIAGVARPADKTYLTLSYTEAFRGVMTGCIDAPGSTRLASVTLQDLLPPDTAEFKHRNMGGSADGVRTGALVKTDMNARELTDHYAAQLTTQGWKQVSTYGDAMLAIGSWRKEEDRRVLIGIFSDIRESNSSSHRLEFEVVDPAGKRK